MLSLLLKESLRNAAAEFEYQQTKNLDHVIKGSLHDYLLAIDEMEELVDNGETLNEAFGNMFDGKLLKFLTPVFNKYKECK